MSKPFYANFLTEAGKLLMAGMLISSCASIQPDVPYYGETTKLSYSRDTNPISTIARIMSRKSNAYSVPREDRQRHERCVFFALEKLDLGEECKWFSNKTSTRGAVKVVSAYPSGSRTCYVFFSHLRVHSTTKNWQDTACYSNIDQKWVFIAKN